VADTLTIQIEDITMSEQESDRQDLDHKPENAGNVGEQHKKLNEQGEHPRPRSPQDPDDENNPANHE
jgi:hypothetical protein